MLLFGVMLQNLVFIDLTLLEDKAKVLLGELGAETHY